MAPVTMCLSMRGDPIALAGRTAALKAALLTVMAEFGGEECRVQWTQVGPSEDTLHRVLPLVLQRLEPQGAVQLFQVCKPPPSHPPDVDAPLPSLSLTARPVHVFCWTG